MVKDLKILSYSYKVSPNNNFEIINALCTCPVILSVMLYNYLSLIYTSVVKLLFYNRHYISNGVQFVRWYPINRLYIP